ncbi:MAG: class I SAM-dependent methyltransferase [Candidatus Gottesmanbacteria bacterium]
MQKVNPIPACPFCQGENLKFIIHCKGRTVYKCFECGLISTAAEIIHGQLSPTASLRLKKELQDHEENWFKDCLKEKPYFVARFGKRLAEIEKRKKPGKILDIGCAVGFLLELAQKHGWQVFGVDNSQKVIRYWQKILSPACVFYGTLYEASYDNQFFDAITIFDTLEHIPDLHSFFTEIRRILKKDGLLAIAVPDQAGLTSKILRSHWFDFKSIPHLYFFSPDSLAMVLQQTGFKIILKKSEVAYQCSMKENLPKISRFYPHPFIRFSTLLLEKITNLLGIKTMVIPLDHIYIIAQKQL